VGNAASRNLCCYARSHVQESRAVCHCCGHRKTPYNMVSLISIVVGTGRPHTIWSPLSPLLWAQEDPIQYGLPYRESLVPDPRFPCPQIHPF
jgi:hypothetical protein